MNATKKAKLRELLDTLPEEEIERFIAQGVARTKMATKASTLATRYKSQGRSVAAYKALPQKLAALAEVLDLSEAELLGMDREQILDAMEDLLEELVGADDDEPVESEFAMLPAAGLAQKTARLEAQIVDLERQVRDAEDRAAGPGWVGGWFVRKPAASVATKAASGQMGALEFIATGGFGHRR